jgi:hypothetical protein
MAVVSKKAAGVVGEMVAGNERLTEKRCERRIDGILGSLCTCQGPRDETRLTALSLGTHLPGGVHLDCANIVYE